MKRFLTSALLALGLATPLAAAELTFGLGGVSYPDGDRSAKQVELELRSDPFATDLGNTLEFRTAMDIGRELSNGSRISLGISHISNAGIDDINPGMDAISLRLTRRY